MKTMTRMFLALGLLALLGVAFGAQNEKKEKKGAKGGDPTAAIKSQAGVARSFGRAEGED